jgi:hypothetical protein
MINIMGLNDWLSFIARALIALVFIAITTMLAKSIQDSFKVGPAFAELRFGNAKEQMLDSLRLELVHLLRDELKRLRAKKDE